MAFPSRMEHFNAVDSTQRVVREWLEAGTNEVAVAVADYQTAGRGRQGREWMAPPKKGLLVSVGFKPSEFITPKHAWRLPAIVALAMRDASEEVAGLRDGTVMLKWPNDLVAEAADASLRKVGGVLGESVMAGKRVKSAVVGVGMNTDWKAADFPWALAPAMTSLRELAGRRPIDNQQLLDAFLARLEPRYEALLGGTFDAGGWTIAQRTTGRHVIVELGDNSVSGRATGVDPESGALLVDDEIAGQTAVDTGEVIRCRVM